MEDQYLPQTALIIIHSDAKDDAALRYKTARLAYLMRIYAKNHPN